MIWLQNMKSISIFCKPPILQCASLMHQVGIAILWGALIQKMTLVVIYKYKTKQKIPKNEYPTHFWIRAPKAPGGAKPPISQCIKAPRTEGAPRAVGAVHNVAQDFSQKGFSKLLLKCFEII